MITKIRYRLAARIQSLRGETLIETLAAILVATLAMVMLANAIGIAQSIVVRGREAANEHYEAETTLATTGGPPVRVEITLTDVGGTGESEPPVYVVWREAPVPGGYTVVSYEPM